MESMRNEYLCGTGRAVEEHIIKDSLANVLRGCREPRADPGGGSVLCSVEEVAHRPLTSNIIMSDPEEIARQMLTRCFWPPESEMPCKDITLISHYRMAKTK